MAYADQQMSGNRMAALIIVALLHVALGYALVTGLAYEGAAKLVKKLTTVDIKEEVKKEEPPPPPVAPPVKINVQTTPPQIQTTVTPPPPAPPVLVAAPPAAVVAPPPPPKGPDKQASPKGNPGNWANSNDYPTRALREEKEGVTRFRVTVGADGRVTSCDVTGSSGSPELDTTTCSLITRRGRFNPALSGGSPTAGSWSSSVRWQIPKD
jgi:periplasmic protein TonB